METSQVQNLKLNAANIKSVLISSNKTLRSVQIKKEKLISRESQKSLRRGEERKIESSKITGSGIASGIIKKVTSPFVGIVDRMKNFFGILVLGFIINNLPKIIEEIRKFITVVKPIFDGFMNGLSIIGTGLEKIYTSVSSTFNFNANEAKKNLDVTVDTFKKIDKDADNLLKNETDTPEIQQSEKTTQLKPASEAPLESNSNQKTSQVPVNPPEIQKRKKGGIIHNKQNANLPTSRTTTGNAKTNPLKLFPKVVDQTTETYKLHEGNVSKLSEISKQLQLIGEKKDNKNTNRDDNNKKNLSMFGAFMSPLRESTQKESSVVGRVGSTGASTGPHIHIESGDGVSPHDDAGKEIPNDVLRNIFVGSTPLSRLSRKSGIGNRIHPITGQMKMHYGYDYPAEMNAPITLGKGLELVDYDTTRDPKGFGNNIKIRDKRGNSYIIAHLSSGPEESKLPTTNLEDNIVPISNKQIIPMGTGDLEGFTLVVAKQTVEQVIEVPSNTGGGSFLNLIKGDTTNLEKYNTWRKIANP